MPGGQKVQMCTDLVIRLMKTVFAGIFYSFFKRDFLFILKLLYALTFQSSLLSTSLFHLDFES